MIRLLSQIWYYTKNLKYLFQNNCIVLIYHKVKDLESDPQLLAVSPHFFEEQISYLKKNYQLLSLQELVSCINRKRVPYKSVVITFDDGYTDNLYNALPILKKYHVPATIFITSGMVGSFEEFWWDSLDDIFLTSDINILKRLQINIGDINYDWEIKNDLAAKEVYQQLHTLLKSLPIIARDEKLNELCKWSGRQKQQRTSHAVLSKKELIELSQSSYIEIGAHTISHPRLSNETCKVQEIEIRESKINIEEMIGKKVKSFSYPFGLVDDFSKQSVAIVKECGYNCGIANIQATVSNKTDVYKIPRRLVRNWSIEEFESSIKLFFAKPHNWVDIIKTKLK